CVCVCVCVCVCAVFSVPVEIMYVILTQGQTATLKCTFTTISSTPYLFWYKQEVNSYPKFILTRSRSSADNSPEFVKDRFDAELKDSSVPLMIQDLHVCDSAVYYCALSEVVCK
uniref:Ig-like domain-containing protein n=1 Tax=Gouania willdenowi TaxID=441366 RepID=A0A8C5GQP0_GOUWI